LDRVGKSLRRSENELIMWIETIREEIEIEKGKEKKDKGKKNRRENRDQWFWNRSDRGRGSRGRRSQGAVDDHFVSY